jgi:hypothetical protein
VKLFTFEGGKGVVLSKEMLQQFDELGFSCYSTSRAGLFKVRCAIRFLHELVFE